MVNPDVRKVLIYRLGSLGDTVVALPCLHLIERTYPNAQRLMLTNIPVHAKAPAAAAVIGDSGLVHGYMNYPVGTRNLFTLAKLWGKIRSFGPEALVYLMPLRPQAAVKRDLLFFRACGVNQIVGVPGDGAQAENLRLDEESGLVEPEAQRLMRSLGSIGRLDLEDRANWNLRLNAAERRRAEELLAPLDGRPLICMGIGCKQQPNEWGIENWVALSAALGPRFGGHALALVGAKEDGESSDRVASAWPGLHLNLCGELSPRATAAVMALSELFIGPDSGPGHLAAAVGTACASVFSARNEPGQWFPFGRANQVVYHKTDCFNCKLTLCVEKKKKCIVSVSVDEMVVAAVRAWESRQNASPIFGA